jgi:hypothetical protein
MAVKGLSQLLSRFAAIKPSPKLMRDLALHAVREQKLLAPRKTGNLGRSIGVGRVTDNYAETIAKANYAAFVELGTRPHVIRPKSKKVLRFAPRGAGRLSGSPRKGGAVVFARRVHHPGTKAKPFMVPGAKRAVDALGAEFIVRQWNSAA